MEVNNEPQNCEIQKMFEEYDVVVVTETHFSDRIKCPDDFMLIGRSKKIASKKPRGGVAIYKKKSLKKRSIFPQILEKVSFMQIVSTFKDNWRKDKQEKSCWRKSFFLFPTVVL